MSGATIVRLETKASLAITCAVEAAYPNEACGVLIGVRQDDGWLVTDAVAGSNVHPEPRHRFEVDPRLIFEWMRKLRGSSVSLIGHFHSHPDSPAEPSVTDRDSAYDRNAIWLIAGVTAGRLAGLRAFCPDKAENPSFTEISIIGPAAGA
jgi:proteasome lid subunit RPN8/RPN11